jgi:cyclase
MSASRARVSREIEERPEGYRGPDLSPSRLRLLPEQLGEGTWALMANLPPKDNNGLLVGADAALVIDAGITPDVSRQLQGLASQLSDRPLRYLVNTTYHGDHTFGNAAFARDVVIVSSQLNRAAMDDLPYEKARRSGNMYGEEAALDEVEEWRRPDVTFTHYAEIDLGGRSVQLWQFGPGNSPGDVIAYDPATRTAWTGNFLCHAGIPPMLLEGGPGPYLASLRAMQAALPDLGTVVPGHGPQGDGRAAISWLIGYLERVEQSVAASRRQEATLEETYAALPFPGVGEPSLLAALERYDLPDPTAARAGFENLMRHLHRLNVLAAYRATPPGSPSPTA